MPVPDGFATERFLSRPGGRCGHEKGPPQGPLILTVEHAQRVIWRYSPASLVMRLTSTMARKEAMKPGMIS